ncbi:hypothetical protein [Streptomyces sp. enrichment culture]|uniref:hypothetical protein n=1 Tax=Streptomyces sp. enrichment culture TaxID=1795815 RepID=UPI003F572442
MVKFEAPFDADVKDQASTPVVDRDLVGRVPGPVRSDALAVSAGLVSGGADGAVRAVEVALVAQGVDLGVVFLAQLCIQRDADDASGAGQSPSDIPVGDELADGVLVGRTGCLTGSEPVKETTNSFRSCSTATTSLRGMRISREDMSISRFNSRVGARAQILILLVGLVQEQVRPPVIIGV